MKVVLPGGSGQVGMILARAFLARGHDVVVLSRHPAPQPWRTAQWDATSIGPWARELEGADVVIGLAGRSVNCRYTPANRELIMRSRVESTRVVGDAIAAAKRPPRLWLQASTATIYSHRYDAAQDEATGIIGGNEPDAPDTWRFSIDVARSWEAAVDRFALPETRVVKLRSSVILSPDADGIFDTMLGLVRVGLGGTSGNGRQYVSWIHDRDFVGALDWIIAREHLRGAINVASPNPLPNAEFMRVLRRAWGIGVGLPATDWMLEVGALFMGTETELLLKSRRVVPGVLLHDGFRFEYPAWAAAAADLCSRWRAVRAARPPDQVS
jgi:uncharacterized protein (TIGR01777 family)